MGDNVTEVVALEPLTTANSNNKIVGGVYKGLMPAVTYISSH